MYYFRVRAICDTTEETGDTSMTSAVFDFLFCPNNVGCIDFTNFKGPFCVCSYGTISSSTLPPSGGWGNTGPYTNIGYVDNGPGAYGSNTQTPSQHTLHTDSTEMDSLSNYQLPTIPPGECASVRVGCAYAPESRAASAITYDFVVDTMAADIIVLKYALVTYNPTSHSIN